MSDKPWEFELLRLFACGDVRADLLWSEDRGGALRFSVDCSDTFGWGCADSEGVTGGDMAELRRAHVDARDVDHDWMWPTLWCARKRETRPMRAFYATNLGHEPGWAPPGTMAELFDLAGPARERTMWAP